MAYSRQSWVDQQTVLNAERMTHIEDGIVATEAATVSAAALAQQGVNDAATVATDLDTAEGNLTALTARMDGAHDDIVGLRGTAWVDVPAVSPFTRFSSAGFAVRRIGGCVYFAGGATGTLSSSWQTMATVPVGFRPTVTQTCGGVATGVTNMMFQVFTNGDIKVKAEGTIPSTSLNIYTNLIFYPAD